MDFNSLELAETIKNLILNNGYTVTSENSSPSATFIEAVNYKNEIEFSQMVEEEYYIESSIALISNEILVLYHIIAGEYNSDLFVDTAENRALLKVWEKMLQDEVSRLNLEQFILPLIEEDYE